MCNMVTHWTIFQGTTWKKHTNTASDYMKLVDMSRPKPIIISFYKMQDFQITPITKSYSEPLQ